jgi:hypothetical protein
MNQNSTVLRQIRAALRKGESLSDEQVATLAEIRRASNVAKRHVAVQKLELREGEELWDFVDAVWSAVQTDRIILADGSLDAWLVGIYDDFVIVQDGNTGRLFQAKFERNEKGEFVFGEPTEVRQAFVPVAAPKEDADEAEKAISKRAANVEFVELGKSKKGKWDGVLPTAFRRRR